MANSSANTVERRLRRSDPSTIQDKFLVGYQGWFTCGGDGEPIGPGHHGWLHWFNSPLPDGGRPNTDLWPDISLYSPSELYPAPGLKNNAGEQVFLFSSRNAKTVQRGVLFSAALHFHWMAEHGVDGAFLQRFASETDVEAGGEGIRRIRDEVGDRVREAAEKEGRVFAIMYDVSSVPADRIGRILERDWAHLVRVKGVLDSPNYLQEKGRPVIGLWGFGLNGTGHTPSLLRSIISTLRNVTPGGAYILAGVPAQWRTSTGDADRNPEFVNVWLNEVDAISPWTIGRYTSENEADGFAETTMKGDSEWLRKRVEEGFRKIDYIPVVFPGGSGYNLSEGKWSWNGIKRNGGRFLWKQIYNARKLGVRTMYGAMWDEYDEGTAFIPVVTHRGLLPITEKFKFMALDEDGYDLPADWYMRISGFAAEVLHGERRIYETFPSKELQDYWSSRPKYEEISVQPVSSGSDPNFDTGANDANKKPAGQSYEDWLTLQNDGKEEVPPPPYSLEAEEVPAAAPATTASSVQVSSNANAGIAPSPSLSANVARPAVPASTLSATNPTTSIPPPTHPSRPPRASDPVASLSNELGRANISYSPPPVHPAHPAAMASAGRPSPPVPNMNTRPTSMSPRPQQSQINMATRPLSASPSPAPPQGGRYPPPSGPPQNVGASYPSPTGPPPHVASAYPPPNGPPPPQSVRPSYPSPSGPPPQHHQQQQEENTGSGPWSQAQWPPSEWKISNNNNITPPTTSYPVYKPSGGTGGANLSRPHTFSAGHHQSLDPPNTGANLRPSASVGGGGRTSFSGGSSGNPPPPAPSPGPGFPSGPPGATASSTYPGQHTPFSTYPGQQTFYHSPPHSPVLSYPPVGQPISYPSPSIPSNDHSMTGHNAGHYSGYSPSLHPPHPPGRVSSPMLPQLPYVPSPSPGPAFPGPGGGYFPQPQGPQMDQQPYGQSQFPQPGPGPWVPVTTMGGGSPPSFPPPPNSYYGRQPMGGGPIFLGTSSGSGSGSTSTTQSALGLAMSAVDKVAGKKTREQIEAAGSKLFGKFNR